MSDTATAPTTESATPEVAVTSPKVSTKVRLEEGAYILEKNKFSGDKSGFWFWIIQFKTLEGIIEHYNKLGKDGKLVVCDLANRQLNFAMRNKAQNKLNMPAEERAAKLSRGENVLITEQDAREYVPGERDITSVSGLQKLIKETQEAALEAKKANNTELLASLKEDLKAYTAELSQLIMDSV